MFLEAAGFWPGTALKPARPKDAARLLIRQCNAGVPMVVYSRIVENISVRGCQDPAFNLLASALRRWFPLARIIHQPKKSTREGTFGGQDACQNNPSQEPHDPQTSSSNGQGAGQIGLIVTIGHNAPAQPSWG